MVWLVPFFPLMGVLLNGLLGPRLGKGFVKVVGPLVMLAAFVVSAAIFFQLLGQSADQRSSEVFLWQWISSGVFQAPVALRIDPLHGHGASFGLRLAGPSSCCQVPRVEFSMSGRAISPAIARMASSSVTRG